MSLRTSHSDDNLVIDEALSVHYTDTVIQGSWSWVYGNMSGTYAQMRECHRYATKSFRYVGMTYAAAKACATAMKSAFKRAFRTSVWDGDCLNGQWLTQNGGNILMADISMTFADGDAYDVNVRVNEDDVRYLKTSDAYNESTLFATEKQRTYGSDAHGTANETET